MLTFGSIKDCWVLWRDAFGDLDLFYSGRGGWDMKVVLNESDISGATCTFLGMQWWYKKAPCFVGQKSNEAVIADGSSASKTQYFTHGQYHQLHGLKQN